MKKLRLFNALIFACLLLTTNILGQQNFQVNKTPESSAITVSFKKPADWGDSPVYLWAWTDDNPQFLGEDWPGIPISEGENGFSSFTFDPSIQAVNIIFSRAGSPQSEDITNVVTSTCYEFDAYVSENTFSVKTVDCPAPSYTVSVSANPAEGGTVTGGGSYESGTSCTVTSIAYGGYVFTGWTENNEVVSTELSYTFNVEQDRTLTANFEEDGSPFISITVSFKKPADWGETPVYLWAWTENNQNLLGEDWPGIALSESNNGFSSYTFDSSVKIVNIIFSKDGSPQSTNITNVVKSTCYALDAYVSENTFSVKTVDCPAPSYTVSVSANPAEGGTVTGGGNYESGTSCTVTAIAYGGYVFTGWTENNEVVSTELSYTFNVEQDRTLTANFEEDGSPFIPITVSFKKPADWGETPVYLWAWTENNQNLLGEDWPGIALSEGNNGFSSYTFDSSVKIVNIIFSKDGSPQSTNITNVVKSTCYEFDAYVSENTFSVKTVDCPAPSYTVSVSANPAEGGTVTGGGNYESGTSCTVTAIAYGGYVFTGWTENNEVVSTELSYTFNVQNDRILTANFEADGSPFTPITVSFQKPADWGETPVYLWAWTENNQNLLGEDWPGIALSEGNNGFSSYTFDSSVKIVNIIFSKDGSPQSTNITNVVKSTCYALDAYVSENTFSVKTVDCPAPSYTVSVSANPAEGGTVTGGGNYESGTSCTVTAIAYGGYVFTGWTENNEVVSTELSYTFNVEQDRTLTANFEEDGSPFIPITVSFRKPVDWGDAPVYLWAWTDGSNLFDVWPGIALTEGENGFASYTFDSSVRTVNVIFSKNGSPQSVDINNVVESTCYLLDAYVAENIFSVQAVDCSKSYYSISVLANPTTGGIVTGGGSFESGTPCAVTATANAGFVFTGWTENGTVVSTDSVYLFSVENDRILTANFEDDGTPFTPITVSFRKPADWGETPVYLWAWTENNQNLLGEDWPGIALSEGNNGFSSYTFDSSVRTVSIVFSKNGSPQSMDIDNVVESTCYVLDAYVADGFFSVKAVDCSAPLYTVSVLANPTTGGTVIGGGSYESGTFCTVTAIAYGGYVFTGWTENNEVVSTELSYTFTVEKDRTLTANFEEDDSPFIPITVSFKKPADWGETPVYLWAWTENNQNLLGEDWPGIALSEGNNGFSSYTFDSSVKIVNIIFSKNGSPQSTNITNVVKSTCYALDAYVSENTFSVKTVDCPAPSYTVSVSANPAEGGTVTGGGSYESGTSCTVTAIAYGGYVFTGWTENNEVVSTELSYTFNVEKDRVLTANFEEDGSPFIPITVSFKKPVDWGETPVYLWAWTENNQNLLGEDWPGIALSEGNNGFSSYTFDSSVKIVNIIFSKNGSPQSTNITNVVKSTCYALDAYVSENTFSVKTVDCPAPSYIVSVSANPTEGGTVTGGGSYESGTSCTVTAIAYGGYIFTGWTENGSVVFTDSVYEFIVEKDRTLTANFNLTTDLKDLSRYNINTYVTQRKIIIENATGWDIKVIDVTGKVVYINKVSSNREEVPILVPGIYIIKMYRNEDVGSQKIVVR